MYALSIRPEPMLDILQHGKLVENRTWTTKVRGLIALHRSKVQPAIVAVAELVECYDLDVVEDALGKDVIEKFPWDAHNNENYVEGPYCWLLRSVRKVGPYPISGRLGLWPVPSIIAGYILGEIGEI